MEINEKNTSRPESGGEGQTPREGGKRPGRNHHRRGKGRGQGNRPAGKPEGQPAAETVAATAPEAPAAAEGSKKTNRDNHDHRNGRGRDNRNARDDKKNAEDTPSREKDTAKAAESGHKSRHSTGRPQRAIHSSNTETELPNMDDLLIEDGMVPADPAALAAARPAVEDNAEEIERILAHDVFASHKEIIPEIIPEGKVVIVGVRFRAGGKTYFFDPGEMDCPMGKYAIVETARGLEFGEICLSNRLMDESMVVPPLRPVVRMATPEDITHNRENREREQDAFRIGVQKINEHKLDMKLVEVQYTFDNSKLLFYFTSAKRVDFRELVKDLAGVFHLRIELRQIGIRDEARMIGGLGPCGRPLCCTTFLSDFGQVSMKMAKEQNLSLNSTKISGCCGRLMCCLRYEHEAYVYELKNMPAVGSFVNTPDGPGMVTEVYVLKNEVKVSLRGQPDTAPKKYKTTEVEPQVRDRRPEPIVPEKSEPETDTNPMDEPDCEA